MKVTVENKKGLNKDIKVFIDKETMNSYMDEKYEEIKKTVNLKGFRPGKVPKEVLKRQFGQAIFSEVLDKVLKDTSVKALEDNKIKPAGQPKLDLKTYGEDKDLEYVMSITELPKVELKSVENIKFDEYSVKIDTNETDKRIKEIATSQNNFKEVAADVKAVEENLVIFDYKATIDGKDFTGGEGKNTQLILGKDLFIKGFDKQLIGVKKNDEKSVDVTLPENYPQKEYANKKANFICKIIEVKKSEEVKIDDDFAKNLGAKDLADLKGLVSKQINDEYKNSLDKYMDILSKTDEEIYELAKPIWDNLVKSSNLRDYGGFTKDFSTQMLFGANEVELGKQWANNKIITNLKETFDPFGCLRRGVHITVLIKQTNKEISGEFLGRLVLGEEDGAVKVFGATIY